MSSSFDDLNEIVDGETDGERSRKSVDFHPLSRHTESSQSTSSKHSSLSRRSLRSNSSQKYLEPLTSPLPSARGSVRTPQVFFGTMSRPWQKSREQLHNAPFSKLKLGVGSKQASSEAITAPVARFSGSSRDQVQKHQFLSKEAARTTGMGHTSPGPVYLPQGSLGDQSESERPSTSSTRFGTSKRTPINRMMINNGTLVDTQPVVTCYYKYPSTLDQAHAFSFGTSGRSTITSDFSPGPVYGLNSGIGRGPSACIRSKVSKLEYKKKEDYRNHGVAKLGQQMRKRTPGSGFGRSSSREARSKVYLPPPSRSYISVRSSNV